MVNNYNLITEKWLPVMQANGQPGAASLMDCYTREDIADLAVFPHEYIALMRLLCGIVYAAKGLPGADGWSTGSVREDVVRYLGLWQEAFYLFGERPFLQIANLEPSSPRSGKTACDKLDFGLASGNNSAFFDPHARYPRAFPPERLAINLVTYQAFSPGGLTGSVLWRGRFSNASSTDAPCISCSMLHVLRQRSTLLDTILANMYTRSELFVYEALGGDWLGRPVWERMPQSLDDEENWRNATETFLGRLVPLTRLIRLFPDGVEMLLGTGRRFPVFSDPQKPFPPEGTAVLVPSRKKKKTEPVLLGLLPGVEAWRHVPALLAYERLAHDGRMFRQGEDERLFVGGVIRDQSEIVDVVGSTLTLPFTLASDEGKGALRINILFTERIARVLAGAVMRFGEAAGMEPSAVRERIMVAYWSGVHAGLDLLWKAAKLPEEEAGWKTWRGHVLRQAWRAYRRVCPVKQVRRLRAYCMGRRVLAGGIGKILKNLTDEE